MSGATHLAKMLKVMAAGCCENYRNYMSGRDTWRVAGSPLPCVCFYGKCGCRSERVTVTACESVCEEVAKAYAKLQAAAAAAGKSSQFKRSFAQRISAASWLDKLWQVIWGTDTPEKPKSNTLGLICFSDYEMWKGERWGEVLRRHKIQATKSQALFWGGSVSCCAQAQRIMKRCGSLRRRFSNTLFSSRNQVLSSVGKSCRQPPPRLCGDHFCTTWNEKEGEHHFPFTAIIPSLNKYPGYVYKTCSMYVAPV